MDWVAKGYTWEEAKSGLESESKKPPAKTAPSSKAQQAEHEQRRKIQQVNSEAMNAVKQSDGYVDPADVCRYLIKKSRLDQPYNCLKQPGEDEPNPFHFVRDMCAQTIDKEHIYAAVMTEQNEAAARSRRREEHRTRSTPKAIKKQQAQTKPTPSTIVLDPRESKNPTSAVVDDVVVDDVVDDVVDEHATESAVSEVGDDAAVIAGGNDDGSNTEEQDESPTSKNSMATVSAPTDPDDGNSGSDKESLQRRRGLWK